jgi:hypothetical protein
MFNDGHCDCIIKLKEKNSDLKNTIEKDVWMLLLSYFDYSQIWVYDLIDDDHSDYITEWKETQQYWTKAWCRQILNKQDPTYWYSLTSKLPGHCLLCQKKTTLNMGNGSNHSKHDKLWNWWEVHILFQFLLIENWSLIFS